MSAKKPAGYIKRREDLVVVPSSPDIHKLTKRIGKVHLRQRLGIEAEHATQVFGRGRTFFHIENWYLMHSLMQLLLKSMGLYQRGRRNACNIQIVHNDVILPRLPPVFQGFTLLQLSDLHLDMDRDYPTALIERLRQVDYDICVMTGDFRARTYGDYEPALEALARVRAHIHRPAFAILGNHDSIRMTPAMEEMGVTLLLNEAVAIRRGGASLYLAGIDDPHYFELDNIEKAAHEIPHEAVSVLLSHSPEIYRRAAHAGFDLMLSGHTHGGQLCLPGGLALMMNADCPRRFCRGPWRHHTMQGYTSVGSGASIVNVRYNCLPEITLHRLRRP